MSLAVFMERKSFPPFAGCSDDALFLHTDIIFSIVFSRRFSPVLEIS